MKELAILSNSENLNYDQLKNIQLQFTNWYYAKGGGLLMDKYSQNAYIDFQKQLKFILDYSNKQTELSYYDNYLIKVLSYKLRVALIAEIDVNATTLLGKNEKKKIDEETLKSYHKLFVEYNIDDKDSDKPDYIKSYVKAMEEYYWKKFYKEKLKDYRKKIVLKGHRKEIYEAIKSFRDRFLD